MKAKFNARFAYWFDNVMSRGLVSLISLLAFASVVLIAGISALVGLFGLYPPNKELDYQEIFWASLLRTLDPGTMGQDEGFGFRAAMLCVTIGGIILVASLIGIISNAFNLKVEQLRKGRSRVLEVDHTLILGWNNKIFNLIHEISLANESRKKPVVVILADRDKVQMEDEIRAKLGRANGTRVIVRSGSPLSMTDVQIVCPDEARSIVILSPDDNQDADSITIKTCLALINQRERKATKYHIVGEIKDTRNLEAARLVGGVEAHWVQGEDLICRIIVQTCRQSGLSSVFTELLDFEGSELYLKNFPELSGFTYGEASMMFSTGCLLGVYRNDLPVLNPDPKFLLEANDLCVVVAEDDSHISIGTVAPHRLDLITGLRKTTSQQEKTLILGSNSNLPEILREMAEYMKAGSSVTVLSESAAMQDVGNDALKVQFQIGDPTSRSVLDRIAIEDFDHIIVLASRENSDIQHSDARTLLTLLHLRDIAKQRNANVNIVSEMLDDTNRELAQSTDADDFIVSDKLVSLMLAQLEESPDLANIFTSLLSSEGSEIKLQPIENYVKLQTPVDFNTLVAAASLNGESALGYSLVKNRSSDNRVFGLELAPNRSQLVSFELGDVLAVLTNN